MSSRGSRSEKEQHDKIYTPIYFELYFNSPEDGSVTRQRPLGVEADTVKVGVVCPALNKRSRAHSLGGLSAVPELGGKLGGGTIGDHEHAALDLVSLCGGDSPETSSLVKLGRDNLEALSEGGTRALGAARNADIKVDTLDSAACCLSKLLLRGTDVRGSVGADEATRIGKVSLVVVDELLEHTHVLQDANGGCANGITAVLVSGEVLLVQESNLEDACMRTENQFKTLFPCSKTSDPLLLHSSFR